jgi:hypothetical protein
MGEVRRLDLMDDPSTIGAAIQLLLLVNPKRPFTLTRVGDEMVIHAED